MKKKLIFGVVLIIIITFLGIILIKQSYFDKKNSSDSIKYQTDSANVSESDDTPTNIMYPMIYYNDNIYRGGNPVKIVIDTTKLFGGEEDYSTMAYLGEIKSTVGIENKPTVNFQANCYSVGCRLYQYDEDTILLIYTLNSYEAGDLFTLE